MAYQFSYLIGDLILLCVWFILYFVRRDTRQEMVVISCIFGIAGLTSGLVYILDWWRPPTITGTVIGLEDFILGFVLGGIASVIYVEVFRKRLLIKIRTNKQSLKGNKNFGFLIFLSIILFFGSYFILSYSSFIASIIALLIPTVIIWIKRKDLIIDSLTSGLLVSLVGMLFFVTEWINPGWVVSHWYLENLSGERFLSIPIEDLIWAFLVGMYIGPLYEYWKDEKVVDN